jgi:hypothetical protein
MARRRRKVKTPVEQSVTALGYLAAVPVVLISCLLRKPKNK